MNGHIHFFFFLAEKLLRDLEMDLDDINEKEKRLVKSVDAYLYDDEGINSVVINMLMLFKR